MEAGWWPITRRTASRAWMRATAFSHPSATASRSAVRGSAIPTLASVLRRYPDVPLIIELESELPGDGTEVARRTVDVVRQADAVGRVALGSFSGRALRTGAPLEPALRTGAAREETRWALYRSWVGWPLGRPALPGVPGPRTSGRDDGRQPGGSSSTRTNPASP